MQPAQTECESTIFDSVIVRYGGEVGIKRTWTRRAYERRLRKNIKNMLARHEIPSNKFIRKHGRLFLRTSSAIETSHKLSRVFGVSSLSPAIETTSKLSDIVDKSVYLAGLRLRDGNSFAVRCRRVGHHPYTSTDVCEKVGRQVLDSFPELLPRVKLKDPDVELGIEIRDDQAFVYSMVVDGPGGLPLGTQPKIVGLLNGGVSSSVACWLTMKRGCPLVPLHFDNTPFADEKTTESAMDVAKILFEWAVGFPRRVYVVPHGQNLAEFGRMKRFEHLRSVLGKRLMYLVAEQIADMVRAEAIVTGEAIGEHANQTLRNLRMLDSAVTKYPIHRPLLGFDKVETEGIARRIGTYERSIQTAKECSEIPTKQATRAEIHEVAEAEEALNMKKMVERSIESLKIVNI